MAQHDMIIDNGPGLAVRTDINAALGAVVTNYSGPTEPPTKYPGMFWLDTSAGGDGVLKFRNQANAAWVDPPTGTQFVKKAGDTMTGQLIISYADPYIIFDKKASGQGEGIFGHINGKARWLLSIGDGNPESGSNAGSNFSIYRYNDAGTVLGTPMTINRATGHAAFEGYVYANNSFVSAVSSIVLAPTGAGTVNLRPNGVGNAAAELVLSTGGATLSSGVMNIAHPTASATMSFTSGGLAKGHLIATAANVFQMQNPVSGQILALNATPIMGINGNAQKPGGGAWLDSSDSRIKNVTGDYESGLSAVLALQPVRFTYKGNDTPDTPSNSRGFPTDEGTEPESTEEAAVPYGNSIHYLEAVDAKEFIGLIAQDAETAMPELVKQTTGFIDGVEVADLRVLDPSPLVFALINAVKELSARIEALEAVP